LEQEDHLDPVDPDPLGDLSVLVLLKDPADHLDLYPLGIHLDQGYLTVRAARALPLSQGDHQRL